MMEVQRKPKNSRSRVWYSKSHATLRQTCQSTCLLAMLLFASLHVGQLKVVLACSFYLATCVHRFLTRALSVIVVRVCSCLNQLESAVNQRISLSVRSNTTDPVVVNPKATDGVDPRVVRVCSDKVGILLPRQFHVRRFDCSFTAPVTS